MIQKHNANPKAKMQKRILLYMIIFAFIILSVIWILQTVFLDDIYKAITVSKIRKDTSDILRHSENADFSEEVYDLATKRDTCISVYKIENGRGKEYITAHLKPRCIIHTTVAEGIVGDIYKSSSDNTVYTQILEADNENFADSILASKLKALDDGSEILVILNTEIQPVNATVETLRSLLIFITFIVLVLTFGISYLISNSVTKPVIDMNREAKRLALGNYDVDFSGGDFLETSELAATLNYAASELSKLDTMQKELIANISHDLRTPLTMISGYSEVMRDIPGEMTSENMQIIIDETARLNSLVNDMLDLSRIAGGKRKLNITHFSLSELARAALERYSALRERDGYIFEFSSDEELYVDSDETLILQVIYNLVNNAINYSGEDKTVRVNLRRDGEYAVLSVSDNGEGIPSEKLSLIWDRYYKASDYHKRAVSGTGLGLSIVKNALISIGADFGVKSTVGSGSTFWFSLKINNN